jgi:hypothetical protein
MVFQGCELSLAHIRFSQMRYTDAIKCEGESIGRWCRRYFGISRREERGSPLRFHSMLRTARESPRVAHRHPPFEKLVHRVPAILAPGSGHFPFMGGEQRTGES